MALNPTCPASTWEVWGGLSPLAQSSPCPRSCLQAAHRPGPLPEAGDALGLRRGSGQVHHVQLRRLQGQWEPVLLGEGVQGVLRGSYAGRYPHPARTLSAPHHTALCRVAACTISCPTPGWVWVGWVCLALGQGCPGSGWVQDRSVLGLGRVQDGSILGLAWLCAVPGMGRELTD